MDISKLSKTPLGKLANEGTVLEVACPTCGVGVGNCCRTASNKAARHPHRARVDVRAATVEMENDPIWPEGTYVGSDYLRVLRVKGSNRLFQVVEQKYSEVAFNNGLPYFQYAGFMLGSVGCPDASGNRVYVRGKNVSEDNGLFTVDSMRLGEFKELIEAYCQHMSETETKTKKDKEKDMPKTTPKTMYFVDVSGIGISGPMPVEDLANTLAEYPGRDLQVYEAWPVQVTLTCEIHQMDGREEEA